MKTNIFLGQYQQAENKLTYNFVSLVEHLERESQVFLFRKLFPNLSLSAEKFELECDLVYGGQTSNPDGAFHFSTETSAYCTVYLENKTFRRELNEQQIQNHLANFCQGDHDFLLVITTNPGDRTPLQKICLEDKLFFYTWPEMITILKEVATSIDNEKDIFLIDEFIEYGHQGGEFMELGVITSEDMANYSEHLKLQGSVNVFFNKWRYVLESSRQLLDSIVGEFWDADGSSGFLDHYGRCGYDYWFRHSPYGQWLSIGLYYNTYDHKIPFKSEHTPELAIFYDINPKWRQTLRRNSELLESLKFFEDNGFENNLTKSITVNKWRFVFYRKPVTDLGKGITAKVLCDFLTEKLRLFFSNQKFFKCMGHQGKGKRRS